MVFRNSLLLCVPSKAVCRQSQTTMGPTRRSRNEVNPLIKGGFQLPDLIITELKSHMTCYNSMPLIG